MNSTFFVIAGKTGKWDEDDVFVYNPPVNDKAISTLPVFSLGYVNFSDESTSNQPHLSVQTLEVNTMVN